MPQKLSRPHTIFCEGVDCPVKELCNRFTDKPKEGRGHRLIGLFSETPGMYAEVSGKQVWVCDKKL